MSSKSKTELQIENLQLQINEITARINSLTDLTGGKFIEIENQLADLQQQLSEQTAGTTRAI